IAAGLKTPKPFTVDPRPCDFRNVPVNPVEALVFKKVMYAKQDDYEAQLRAVGLKDGRAFTCACYFEEVGNIPSRGDMLAWAESSAVVYANSVLGARSNRNSGVLELMCGIAGKAPRFGFLTDEGRKASWVVELRTTALPEAQLLGSAIGMKVVEDVPYIKGLDRYLGAELDERAKDYLKDMGAASASNGAVGLYHVAGLTPEAKDEGESLVEPGAGVYVIDDEEIERVRAGYPMMWKDEGAKPTRCFIGCPHLSKAQLYGWLDRIEGSLAAAGRGRVAVPTVLTTAPDVEAAFRADSAASARLKATGATLSSICPLMYMNNPLCGKKPVITNSNKLRTYTKARYYTDAEIQAIVAGGKA
ncbi:MAG: aconitase X catalytic domain-containing protein, partial [Spirochaetes bacterium]|nr:aconitase X catalytic domain-containing protein [Spirochaetota bacterium]